MTTARPDSRQTTPPNHITDLEAVPPTTRTGDSQVKDRIAGIYADGWSRIVATMIRFTGGDWDLAEECAQDAFTQALQKWPESGMPNQPLAWLTTTARNRAVDRMRRASTEAAK